LADIQIIDEHTVGTVFAAQPAVAGAVVVWPIVGSV
jgi:hypothetical protein